MKQNITGLVEDVGSVSTDVMSLNYSITGLNQGLSMKLESLNITQVRNEYVCFFVAPKVLIIVIDS